MWRLVIVLVLVGCASNKETALKELDNKYQKLENEVKRYYNRSIPNCEILTPEQEFKLIKYKLYAAGTICKECFEGVYERCKDCCTCCYTDHDMCCCLHIDKCTCVKDPTDGKQ